MKNHLKSSFFGLADQKSFIGGIQQAIINNAQGAYTGANLYTYHRNLGSLDDDPGSEAG